MTEGIIIALISSLGGVLGAWIGAYATIQAAKTKDHFQGHDGEVKKSYLWAGILFGITIGAVLALTGSGLFAYRGSKPLPPTTPNANIVSISGSTPASEITATPTSWPLEAIISTDPKPLCSLTVSDFKESGKENIKQLAFNNEPGGYCSWIIPLNGYNASTKKKFTIWIRGKKGGEKYDIGLKDNLTPPGLEPKVTKLAFISWEQVSIPLDQFKSQSLISLANFSLTFKEDSGIIYVSDLVFVP